MKLLIDLQGAQTESRLRGIGRQTRMLARSMIEHGGAHDISILLNRSLPDGFEQVRHEFSELLPPQCIKVFEIPCPVAERDPGNLWRMRSAELMRESVISGLNPDVLYLSSLFEGINDDAVTSIGLLESNVVTATTLFDLIPFFDPVKYLSDPAARRFYYRRAQSLKRADLLLAISQSAKQEAVDLLHVPGDKIEVTLLAAGEEFKSITLSPADRSMLRSKYKLGKSFILYVGAIEERKNVSLIIEAFGRLPGALRQSHTIVFGGRILSQERLQLRSAACRAGVDPAKIVFPGFISDADLPALYALCDAFVFPSTHEGFGLPPLEAMACGAPVLAARNSSLPEVMVREDLMFGTFDADELAKKLQRLLTDASYAASVRDWGIERAANFSWDATGQAAIRSLEQLHERKSQQAAKIVPTGRRQRLAYFSPLPSDRSGIADYSVDLLKELGRFYDIECIIDGSTVDDPWVLANFVLRDVDFFRRHASTYDRVVYNVGNSSFHVHMFELLETHPGVVILHDFFMSGILNWLGNTGRASPDLFTRELYLTHGLPALRLLTQEGREAAATRYPANRLAFQEAFGVIVHSRWAIEHAEKIYGSSIVEKMSHVPQLRAASYPRDRSASRQRLAIAPGDFVVCSFGFVAETKLCHLLLEAWRMSKAASVRSCRLIFVGDIGEGEWSNKFRSSLAIDDAGRVEVSGFVSSQTYNDYLHSADLAVQLRTSGRGETSRAVLDCMAAEVPLIINAHGPAREIPDQAACIIADEFEVTELMSAIDLLFCDRNLAARYAAAGVDYTRNHHHPAAVGEMMSAAIERFYAVSDGARQQRLLESLRELYAPVAPTEDDLTKMSVVVADIVPRIGQRRILFDVTLLAENDAHTGIERVVRSMMTHLMLAPPPGYRLEPVRIQGSELRFARSFVAQRLGLPADVLPDNVVDFDSGDLYVMLEWAADRLPQITPWLQRLRAGGGRVVIGINDLLPLIMPRMFPPSLGPVAERWFEHVLLVADQLMCISRTVADDVLRIGNALNEGKNGTIIVDWYHCAHDVEASVPTHGLPANAASVFAALRQRPSFLMVGTVEPRKGHLKVLLAFEKLWRRSIDVALVIVGKKGWMVDTVEKRIAESREGQKRLFWLRDVSDEYLEKLYASSSALIAASEGEGFGLPLVEAASHNLPIIARDIPVFREVAGDHAFYFTDDSPDGLTDAIHHWMAAFRAHRIKDTKSMHRQTWAQSARDFSEALISGHRHYGSISAAKPQIMPAQKAECLLV